MFHMILQGDIFKTSWRIREFLDVFINKIQTWMKTLKI
jgi:hypothetical protein